MVAKKKAVKRTVVKKAIVKKTVAKKVTAKKITVKKAVTPKRSVAVKKTVKKTTASKPKITKSKTTKPVSKKIVDSAPKKTKIVKNKIIKKKTSTKKIIKKAEALKSKRAKITKTATKKKITTTKKPVQKLTFTADLFSYDELSNSKEEMALTKYDIGAHTTYSEYAYDPMQTEEPPAVYLIDRLVLMPVDPKFAFMYWELREETLNYYLGVHGYDSKLTLRVYDVTNVDFNGHNAHEWWDVEIYTRVGTWYLKHYRGDRSLAVDIGLVSKDGVFHAISRSRSMYFPRDKMVDPGKILWMLVDEFGNKIISEIEDYTDDDLRLLKRILGDERFKKFLKGGLDVFLGGSAWGRLPVIENFLDLSKIPSVSSPGSAWPSSPGRRGRD